MILLRYAQTIWQHRTLLRALVWRDFCTRYKQAVLGFGWAVIYPIALTLILWFAFEVLQRGPRGERPPLLMYYSGLHPFNLFASCVIYGTISIVANGGLLTKVKVPTEAFPLSSVLSGLFDFAFGGVALVGLMLWYHSSVTLSVHVIWAAVAIAGELVLTLAVVQVFAAACVIARDLRYGAPILCQLLLFLVPVIYEVPAEASGVWRLYLLNPLAVYVDTFRRGLLDGLPPRWAYFGLAWVMSLAALWLSCRLFDNARLKFSDLL